MDTAKENNIKVMAWFPGSYEETEEDLEKLINFGVNRICGNKPNLLQKLLLN